MGNRSGRSELVDAAFGAIVADGCFCLAFMIHLAGSSTPLGLLDYLAMGAVIGTFLSACWVINYDYWRNRPAIPAVVKTLRVQELDKGAAIEFDGKSYRVDSIDRSLGRIDIARVEEPGRIVVQIEGKATPPWPSR